MTKTINALKEARKTGIIPITTPTIAILESMARFNESAEDLMETLTAFMPDTMQDTKTIDNITNDFYDKLEHTQQSAYASIGRAILTELFSTVNFRGI